MKVLFVCTGNTCRSPMAEYLLRHRLLQKGIEGVEVTSGGLCVAGGAGASKGSVSALQEWGIDLTHFISKPINPEEIAGADIILTMTDGHKRTLSEHLPQFSEKIQTLNPGGDISDPYMQGKDVYCKTRDEIDFWIQKRIEDGMFD